MLFGMLGFIDVKVLGLSLVVLEGGYCNWIFFYILEGWCGLFVMVGGVLKLFVNVVFVLVDVDFFVEIEFDMLVVYVGLCVVV